MTVAQLRGLAGLADAHGRGRLRLSHQQNIILPDLPAARLDEVRQALLTLGFTLDPLGWQGRLVVCTGKALCTRAIVHTKEVAVPLAAALDALIPGAPFPCKSAAVRMVAPAMPSPTSACKAPC